MSVTKIDSNGIYEETCKTWDAFRKTVNKMILKPKTPLKKKEWIFRGILEKHPLKTTLERVCKYWDIPLNRLPYIEKQLIREIKRKAFGFGIPLPKEEDTIWWVSLMQHYGAPTRLLDFTYSPYIAAYFAFEKLLFDNKKKESAVVWAVQHEWTNLYKEQIKDKELLKDIAASKSGVLDKLKLFDPDKPRKPSIMQVNALYLHDRITAQQGVFLLPTDISVSFMENFKSVPGYQNKNMVKKLILPKTIMDNALAELQKMNISRHSLFPGMGGLAESLSYRLPYFNDLAKFHDRQ